MSTTPYAETGDLSSAQALPRELARDDLAVELRWPDEPCTLVVDSVVLRPWMSTDRDAMVLACNDPEVPRWTTVPTPYTHADADAFIESAPGLWTARTGMCFAVDSAEHPLSTAPSATGAQGTTTGGAPSVRAAIEAPVERSDRDLVGSIGVVDVDHDSATAEIGYWTAPWARRRGLTSASLDLLSAWLLDDVGFGTLDLVIDPMNVASIGVARRCGYRTYDGATTGRPVPDGHVVWRRSA